MGRYALEGTWIFSYILRHYTSYMKSYICKQSDFVKNSNNISTTAY